MPELLDQISQIAIYLKEEQERVNEIALFKPLALKAHFDGSIQPLQQRKWTYTYKLPLLKRISLKIQSFLFKRAPILIPSDRVTNEAKFKTVLTLLLGQESVKEFFLSKHERRKNFFNAIKQVANEIGYQNFKIPANNSDDPHKISQDLTLLSGKNISLLDDPVELNLQMAALNRYERNEILFKILNRVERPPINSIIEILHGDQVKEISLTTKYAKYQICNSIKMNGKIDYLYAENQATSSIRTLTNSRPGVKGTMNQRCVYESQSGDKIGTYSGELIYDFHVLEQILFMLDLEGKEAHLIDQAPRVEEIPIFLTSLFSWNEIDSIQEQHQAIRKLHHKILKIGEDHYVRLKLYHYNVPFNVLNKFPSPSEIDAVLNDLNDKSLIPLTYDIWKKLHLKSEKLQMLKEDFENCQSETDFLIYQKKSYKLVDTFRELKKELIAELNSQPKSAFTSAALGLLKGKKSNGKKLRGIDLLLYLNITVENLGYFHNKNCKNATNRSAGANAADKAQYAYQKICSKAFLPGHADEQETLFFKVLYSMYLVWEEPEINAALSTGFVGEKFYQNFLQKNQETTRYLIDWLKKHPEMHVGLSDYH